jgi:hypothetical protein
MMENLTQGEEILVHLSPTHILELLEGKNIKFEILGQSKSLTRKSQHLTSQSQSLTNYQSTKIMNEKTNRLHY